MIEAAKNNDRKLIISYNQPFVNSHQKYRKLIKASKLGKIYSFRTAFGHPRSEGWT